MSNLERDPSELACAARPEDGTPHGRVLAPREVPLGGPRGMRVRRTLPQRAQPLVGAWCFADHFGPDDVSAGGGMRVAGHPHTGLQTVSWLFDGEVEHRDTTGAHALVRPRRTQPVDFLPLLKEGGSYGSRRRGFCFVAGCLPGVLR